MPNQNASLNIVKTAELFVTNFQGSTADPCFTRGRIDSSPNIFKSGSSFFIDYANTSNTSDLKFLNRFFSGLTTGSTFALVGGTYFIEESGLQVGFAGTYTVVGITGTYKTYISVTGNTYSSSLTDGVYESQNFKYPLKFSATTGNTAQYLISKLNKTSPLNLSFLGVYGNNYGYEEYLEVEGASANSGRYLIDSFVKLQDGSEIIYINPQSTISTENFYAQQKKVNVYMRGIPDLATLSQSKQQNGIITVINSDGKILNVLGEQNLHQKYSRSLYDQDNTYSWYGSIQVSNLENIYNPIAYDGLSLSIDHFSFVKITTVSKALLTLADSSQFFTEQLVQVLFVDNVETSEVIFRATPTSTIIKLDLSDASLYSCKISAYYDEECSLELDETFYFNGVPGYEGASFIYVKNINSPAVVYLKFELDTVLKLQLTII